MWRAGVVPEARDSQQYVCENVFGNLSLQVRDIVTWCLQDLIHQQSQLLTHVLASNACAENSYYPA